MLEQVTQIHLFYPLLFIFLIVVVVTIGLVIKGNKSDGTFKDIFFKSSDNAKDITIDTTNKMKDMHGKVVDGIPEKYQHELHSIEITVKEEQTKLNKLVQDISDINDKLDILLQWKFETEHKKKK